MLLDLNHFEILNGGYITRYDVWGSAAYKAIWENIAKHDKNTSLFGCNCEQHPKYRKTWLGLKVDGGLYRYLASKREFTEHGRIIDKYLLMLL
jgi:hypothetical protein